MSYTGPERRDNQEEIRDVIKATIQETLATLGLDVSEPFELQEDMSYLRKMRKGTDGVKWAAFICIVTTVIPTMLWLLWRGIRGLIS